jgi:biopolymer transport protein TolR
MVLPKLSSIRSKRDIGTSLAEINVTPFVDVMLVLLVIFMVTTPMMQSGMAVNLPQAETDTAPAETGMKLTVTADKFINIDEGKGTISVININLLENRIRSYYQGKTKKVIYINGDELVPYGFVVGIMDIAKKCGVETVGLGTAPPDDKPKNK